MRDVREKAGVPNAEDFRAGGGTPIVVDTQGEVAYAINSAGSVFALSGAAGGGITNINVSAGATSNNLSRLTFNNGGGVSFGLTGSVITATVATNYQSAGAYLTTAMLSNASSVFAGVGETTTTQAGTALGLTVNTDGVNVAYPNWLTTAQAPGAYLTTARASNDAVGLNTALTANGVAWTVNSSGISLNVPAFLTTAALSNHSHGDPTLALTNLSGTTASASNGFTLSLSAAAPGAGGGVNVAGGGVTQGTGTVNFANSNGITFGLSNNGTMTAAHNGLTTARASNDGVGLGTALTAGPLAWTVNSAGISLNAGSAAGTSTGFTGANISASITHNTAGIAISASVAAPGGGGFSAGVSNLGNTAGSTGVTGTRLVLVGANNISLSQSTDANGGTVSFSVAAPGGGAGITASMWPEIAMPIAVSSVYSCATNTTAGGSRTTVSLYVCPVIIPHDVSFNRVWGHLSMNTSAGTGSVTMGNAFGLYTLNGASLSRLTSWGMGFHLSQNSISARSQQWYWGTNSTSNSSAVSGNVSASFARLNQALYDTVPQSVPAGNYWLVHANTQRSSGLAAALFSYFRVSQSQSTGGSMFGTNVSSRKYLHHGIASTNTTNTRSNNVGDILPPFIETSAITGTGGSSQLHSNIVYLHSATA